MEKGKKAAQKFYLTGITRWFAGGMLVFFLLFILLFLYIRTFLLPDTAELENPRYEIASDFISSDGQVFGKVFKFNREWLNYEDLNPKIVQALVATEDVRYFNHSGIDFRGTARAVFFLGNKGGASTITQQLAKLFFTRRASSFFKRVWQKMKEWVIAVEFEKRYTKEEILVMYLNKSDFLYDAVGIGAAAKTYFGKDQSNLNAEEAAVLIGMLKNPRLYNPIINPENCFKRRSVVLKQMLKADFISEDEYLNKRVKNINTSNFRRQVHFDGIAPYFRMEATKWIKTLLSKDEYKKPDGSNYNLYTDGLKIYTTIDTRIQKYAEKAMFEHMSALQEKYFSRWKNLDPVTYKASKELAETRQRALTQMMKDSERYKKIRTSYMSGILNEISSDLDFSPRDVDIFRMFEEKKKAGHLKRLKSEKTITGEQYDQYISLLSSGHWPDFEKQWKKMQNAVQTSFHTKTKMKVFAYNEYGEKQVEMTPMDSIKYHLQHMQIGSLVVDPKSGQILAWLGGINHKYFQYDHVNSNRQVGSTFKPFIYTTSIIDNAFSPCMKVKDVRQCIPANDPHFGLMETWCPNNADNKYSGEELTLRQALKESVNSVSVYLMKEIGNVKTVKNLVGNLGINQNKVPNSPSICLGTAELSAMDLAMAYTAFANDGMLSKPFFISRIEDRTGRVIYSAVPEQKRAINEGYNYVMVDMLRYVASPIASQFKAQVAGKTGTTNSYKDGWFIGFTPEVVISTWVGGDQEFIRFNSLTDGQGAAMARPFFVSLLKKIEADNTLGFGKNLVFQVPEGEIIELDCSKYEQEIESLEENKSSKKSDEFDEEFNN